MTWSLRVGAVQMRSTGDLAANLALASRLIDQAVAGGAQLVVLPECFAFLGRSEADKLATAEDLDGEVVGPVRAMLADRARTHRVFIVGGGMAEVVPGDPKRTYNTAVVIAPDGQLVTRY